MTGFRQLTLKLLDLVLKITDVSFPRVSEVIFPSSLIHVLSGNRIRIIYTQCDAGFAMLGTRPALWSAIITFDLSVMAELTCREMRELKPRGSGGC